jgi:hypothetical protein
MGGRPYAEGENFRFELDTRAHLTCRVWKRPDLDAEAGASLAHAMAAVWTRAGADPAVVAGLFDLREAPPVFGPRTEEAFRNALGRVGGKRLALLCSTNAVQKLQLQRIAAGHPHVLVADSADVAEAHLAGR